MNFPLLAFIAHLPQLKAEHIAYRDDLTQRGFPCVISNDLNPGKEFPNQDRQQATEVMLNRIATLQNESNRFFIYFIEESTNDPIAAFELGNALAYSHTEHIILIGEKKKSAIHFSGSAERIKHYPNWQGFLANHFFGA